VDVLALQEVDFDPDGRSAALRWLREKTDLAHVVDYPLSVSCVAAGQRAGLAIASRYPLSGVHQVQLPKPSANGSAGTPDVHDKGLLRSTVHLPGWNLVMVCVHLFPFHRFDWAPDDQRSRPVWSAIGEALRPLRHSAFVVAGDFNSTDRELLLRRTAEPLRPAFAEYATHHGRPVDDVLSSGALTLRDRTTVENFSDHALCVAELAPTYR
jgi:endonuclease/exonuclease/phosphatase family metal-dependent hydrolase